MVSAERELSIRARVAAVYNRPEADFASRGEYDDYLEKVRARAAQRARSQHAARRGSHYTRAEAWGSCSKPRDPAPAGGSICKALAGSKTSRCEIWWALTPPPPLWA